MEELAIQKPYLVVAFCYDLQTSSVPLDSIKQLTKIHNIF
jgi:hypothetical protein